MHILLIFFSLCTLSPSSFCASFVRTSLKTVIPLTTTVHLRGVIFSRGGSLVPRKMGVHPFLRQRYSTNSGLVCAYAHVCDASVCMYALLCSLCSPQIFHSSVASRAGRLASFPGSHAPEREH